MIYVRSNNLSLKYQRFEPLGCKDLGIINFYLWQTLSSFACLIKTNTKNKTKNTISFLLLFQESITLWIAIKNDWDTLSFKKTILFSFRFEILSSSELLSSAQMQEYIWKKLLKGKVKNVEKICRLAKIKL